MLSMHLGRRALSRPRRKPPETLASRMDDMTQRCARLDQLLTEARRHRLARQARARLAMSWDLATRKVGAFSVQLDGRPLESDEQAEALEVLVFESITYLLPDAKTHEGRMRAHRITDEIMDLLSLGWPDPPEWSEPDKTKRK